MARRAPATSQEERLERRIRNAEKQLVELRTLIDTTRSVVTADIIKVDDPTSPQILRVSEGGTLETGSESGMRVIGAITEETSHTGDANETELGRITVQANSMGAHGFVRILSSFRAIGAGALHTFKVYFGGDRIQHVFAVANNWMVDFPGFVMNDGAADSQLAGISFGTLHSRVGETPTVLSVDTTADVDIRWTVQNALAAHTAYLRLAFVEAFYSD